MGFYYTVLKTVELNRRFWPGSAGQFEVGFTRKAAYDPLQPFGIEDIGRELLSGCRKMSSPFNHPGC